MHIQKNKLRWTEQKHSKISTETRAKISLIRIGNDTVFFFFSDNVCSTYLREMFSYPHSWINSILITVCYGGNFTSLWKSNGLQ